MNALEAIRARRSVGKLEGVVSEVELETLLEAALCAPNHHLTEPWTFTVLTGDARSRFGRLWAGIVATGLQDDAPAREARLESESRKLLRAPVVIVVSTRTEADATLAAEDFAATAAAIQNILLAAVALDLAAIWRSGEMAYSDLMKTAFGLQLTDRIVGIIYVGKIAADAKPREPRKRAVRRFDS